MPLFASSFPDDFDFKPLSKESVAFSAWSIDSDKEVFSLNSEKEFFVASNVKLITTAAAMEILGNGLRFKTNFLFEPESGTLYIKGGADPSIVVEKLWIIACELKSRNMRTIKKVVYDDFLFGEKGIYSAAGTEGGDNGYLSFISPLNLNYNAVEVSVAPSKTGSPAFVNTLIPGNYFIIKNKTITVAGNALDIDILSRKNGARTELTVVGKIGANIDKPKKIYRRVQTPAEHFIMPLLSFLGENESIPFVRKKIPDTFFSEKNGVLYTYKSEPLREIINTMNKYSCNFIADVLQFYIGFQEKNSPEQGVALLKKYATEKTGLVPDIINGSGLGNGYNKLPPILLIRLMRYFYKNDMMRLDYFSSLPVMGEEGTLKRNNGKLNGKIRAKTGSITAVTSLSGIMKGKSGKIYLFVFVLNNFKEPGYKNMWEYRDRLLDFVWEKL